MFKGHLLLQKWHDVYYQLFIYICIYTLLYVHVLQSLVCCHWNHVTLQCLIKAIISGKHKTKWKHDLPSGTARFFEWTAADNTFVQMFQDHCWTARSTTLAPCLPKHPRTFPLTPWPLTQRLRYSVWFHCLLVAAASQWAVGYCDNAECQ